MFFACLINIIYDFFINKIKPIVKELTCLMLIPLGLALFMLFLHINFGDTLAFKHAQTAWGREPSNPFYILYACFFDPYFATRIWASVIILTNILLLYLFITKRITQIIFTFSLLCIYIPLSTGIYSIMRYTFWIPTILFSYSYIFNTKSLIIFSLVSLPLQIYFYKSWIASCWFLT